MIVIWSQLALRDLTDISNYIRNENAVAAATFEARVLELVNIKLFEQPLLGKTGRSGDTREIVLGHSYILVYRVSQSSLDIVTIRHTARHWPKRGF